MAATDHGQPELSTYGIVEVIVLDWNDNDPQFESSAYVANVTEEVSRFARN